jgi:O-antigen ligase
MSSVSPNAKKYVSRNRLANATDIAGVKQLFMARRRFRTSGLAMLNGSGIWFAAPLAAVGGAAVAHSSAPILLILALLGLAAFLWKPAAFTLALTLICQEIKPTDSTGFLTTLGNQVYYDGTIPLVYLIVAAAVLVALSVRRSRNASPFPPAVRLAILFASLLVMLSTVLSLYAGLAPFSALNQTARPFILLLLSIILGATFNSPKSGANDIRRAAVLGIVVLVGVASLALARGESVDAAVSPFFIFYDSALAAAAAAILLGIMISRGMRVRGEFIVAVACLIIVALSFRRNVWISFVVALIACLMVGRLGRSALKRLGVGVAGLALLAVLVPAVREAALERVADAYLTLSGGYAEASTADHVNDLRVGWRYAMEHPFMGVGPEAPQLGGMAAQKSVRVYVHNELLLDWLRFGVAGAALVLVLQVWAIVAAVAFLRRGMGDLLGACAAAFVLLAPLCMVSAPFLSTTSRWPIFYGMSLGILATLTGGSRSASPTPAQQELTSFAA